MDDGIFIGGGGRDYAEAQHLLLRQGNRHGLIAGATGTGKTVTLQILAEGFSAAGVPVFLSDVKGDVSGLALPGSPESKLHTPFQARAAQIGYNDYAYRACPTLFWDLFGQAGHPIRTTVSEMGPLLLSRMLELTEPQEGVLNIAFRLADDEGLPLLNLADLRAMLTFVAENASDLSTRYGAVAGSSVGAIQRRLLVLENQGGENLFGEPALDIADLMTVDGAGQGRISILAADRLMATPRLYATFLLWLLSELFEELPEVGNPDKPRLVFFFDEAHLLFNDAPRPLVAKVEQVARLIRSKGVGVYFVTQNPDDVPDAVLGQLGNRIQHALRAFTARDRKALRLAAETYRDNPRFSTADAIRDVGTGEAVTSMLDAKGRPGMVERTLIRPPATHLGPIPDDTRRGLIAASPLAGKYDALIDRDSAFERLAARAKAAARAAELAEADNPDEAVEGREYRNALRYGGRAARAGRGRAGGSSRGDSVTTAFAKSFARQLGTRSGQALVRGILGGLFRGR
jgi:DNA helicase HerA-like ATPase